MAKLLVRKWHYAKGGSNTGVAFHGLFEKGSVDCLGVAWWLPPTPNAARAVWDGCWKNVLALSRFATAPDLPTNAESFLLGRSIRILKDEGEWACLLTYADQGQGHEGIIYKATNWEYMGEVGPYTNWYDPETGRQVSQKRGPRNMTVDEMKANGFVKRRTKKHRYRYILE